MILSTTKGQNMKVKPSTKMHEVYDNRVRAIVHVGSRTSCNAYWVHLPAAVRSSAVVRVAGK